MIAVGITAFALAASPIFIVVLASRVLQAGARQCGSPCRRRDLAKRRTESDPGDGRESWVKRCGAEQVAV